MCFYCTAAAVLATEIQVHPTFSHTRSYYCHEHKRSAERPHCTACLATVCHPFIPFPLKSTLHHKAGCTLDSRRHAHTPALLLKVVFISHFTLEASSLCVCRHEPRFHTHLQLCAKTCREHNFEKIFKSRRDTIV